MNTPESPTKLTPLQQELLRMYALDLSEEELNEVKELLDNYFLERLQRKVTKSAKSKGYTQEDFDSWLNDHNQ